MKLRVIKCRNRRGTLRTDFGVRILADRLGRYLAAKLEDDMVLALDLERLRARAWERFVSYGAAEAIKIARLMEPLL